MPIPVSTAVNRQLVGANAQELCNKLSTLVSDLNAQSGTATLVSGTVTVSTVTLTANSVILLSQNTPGGTTGNDYAAPVASRNTGASTFVINATSTAGATVTTDTSTVDWLVIG